MSLLQALGKVKWRLCHQQQIRDYVTLNYCKDEVYRRTIRKSPLFDADYYRRNTGISDKEDAAAHYLKNWMLPGHDPSEGFCSAEYLSLHCDVALSGLNPLVSYELYGRKTGYEISSLQRKKPSFPEGAEYLSREFSGTPAVHRRAAVLACFFSDGLLPETLLILIRGLREVADTVVLVGDCPVYPSEVSKLEGLVRYAVFTRHQQYDFGSYKRGLAFLREKGLLQAADELIFLNDSCFGPVYPLSEAFRTMTKAPCDFWGLTGYRHGKSRFFKTFISSYFYVFRGSVIASGCLEAFMDRIQGPYDRNDVIGHLETEFTAYLEVRGFLWQTLCPDLELDNIYNPLALVAKYRVPLVKKKSFQRTQTEDMNALLEIIRVQNVALGRLLSYAPLPLPDYRLPSIEEHRRTLAEKAARIAEKMKRGEKIKAVFLTGAWDSFPSRFLFEQMCRQRGYDVTAAVIPDLRKDPNARMQALIEAAVRAARMAENGMDGKKILCVRPDQLGRWPDVCADADIVVYNSPLSCSCFRYLPKYAAGRAFLPLMVWDDSVPDGAKRLDACRYVWKILPKDAGTVAELRKESGVQNAENVFQRGKKHYEQSF